MCNVLRKLYHVKNFFWHYCVTSSMGKGQGGASLMTQLVNNPPAMQETKETQVPSLSWEDPLEEGVATHSSIFVPWTQETGGPQSKVSQRVRHN